MKILQMPDIRQTVLIVLSMLMPLAVGGQGYADKVLYKATYATDYFTSFGQKDVMVLDVGESSSHFYSATEKRKKEILDSLNRHGSVSIQEAMRLTADCTSSLSFHIYKDFPEKGRFTFTDEVTPDDIYKYEEDKPDTVKWKMIEADTTISEYKCQKAEDRLRGRKWIVWFTPDIPVADGPWKLCGLPGLILKATDAEGYFAFDCIGIEQGKGEG